MCSPGHLFNIAFVRRANGEDYLQALCEVSSWLFMTLLIPSNVSISPPTGQLGAVDQKAGQTEHLKNVSNCES